MGKKTGKRSADAAPTWYPRGRCYRKRLTIEGQQKEFCYRYPHTSQGQRQAALEWTRELNRIRAGSELSDLQLKAQAILDSLADAQSQTYRQVFSHVAQQMLAGVPEAEAQRRGVSVYSAEKELARGNVDNAQELLTDAVGRSVDKEDRLTSETIGDVLRLYLVAQQRRNELEEISNSRHYSIRRWAERLIETQFGSRSIPTTEEEFGRLLLAYRSYCDKELAAGTYGKSSYDYRMQEIRQFSGWASSNYHFPHLPRNIKDATKQVRNGKADEPAKAFSVSQLCKLAESSAGWSATALALSLNCGFYSVDFATIKAEDIRNGYLYFQRQKTGVRICYKLWEETLSMIDKHGNKSGLLLATDEGKPIYEHVKTTRIDRLYLAYKDLMPQGFSYRNLRDTGASLIEQIDRRWTDSYLAHADKRIARMYIDSSSSDQREIFSGLHAATDEMRNRLLTVLTALAK